MLVKCAMLVKVVFLFKIKCGCYTVSAQSVLGTQVNKSVNQALVLKLYFVFGRVHVHINLRWVNIQKEHIKREVLLGYHLLVSHTNGMVKVRRFNEAVVNEDVLLSPCFLTVLRLANKAINLQGIAFFFHRHYTLGIVIAKQLGNALLKVAAFQVEHLVIVIKQLKGHFGVR